MTDTKKQRINFADCYVLTNKRDKDFIFSFLNNFLPNRQEYGHAFEIPQFSENPTIILKTANELIEYLDQNKNEVHAIYWYNKDESELRGAMCLFTSDGQVIVGLTCETLYPDTTSESNYIDELKRFCNSTIGLIEYEKPAARDTAEFLDRISAISGRNVSKID